MSDITKTQKQDLQYFESRLNDWLGDVAYKGKFVVISKQEVQVIRDRAEDAYRYAVENLEPGQFIIKEIVSKEDSIVYLPSVF